MRPGEFGIDVPAGWTGSDANGIVELEPVSRASSCHISTYSRATPQAPTTADAEAMIRRFPAAQGVTGLDIEVQDLRDYVDASASFAAGVGQAAWLWEVRLRLSEGLVVTWSFNHRGGGDREVAEALSIWASLQLADPPSRGWSRALGFRRRSR